jgi:hypothetical protein
MTGWGNAVGWAAVNLPYGRWRLILVNGPRTGRPSSIGLSAVLRMPSKVAALENVQVSVGGGKSIWIRFTLASGGLQFRNSQDSSLD